VWGAFGVLVFGLVIIMYWALAMFTDTGYGEFARETSAEIGHKNNLALTIPSTGLMFVFGSATMVAEGSDSAPVFVCGILLQLAVLSPLGSAVAGNTNWISLGPIRVQPSEFLKLATILWLAARLGGMRRDDWRISSFLLPTWWPWPAHLRGRYTMPVGTGAIAAPALILLACRHLQVLSLGEQVATILGSPTRRASAVLILLGTVLVAVVTMAAGPIGFVALVAPHLARLLTGSPQSPLLVSGLTGSLLLVGADLLSQLVLESMPVSVVTNAVGGLYLMVALTVAARGRRSL